MTASSVELLEGVGCDVLEELVVRVGFAEDVVDESVVPALEVVSSRVPEVVGVLGPDPAVPDEAVESPDPAVPPPVEPPVESLPVEPSPEVLRAAGVEALGVDAGADRGVGELVGVLGGGPAASDGVTPGAPPDPRLAPTTVPGAGSWL